MESKALDEKFTQTRLGTVEAELVKVEQATKIKDERIRQLEESVHAADEKFAAVFEVLHMTSDAATIREVLERKRWKRKTQHG